MYDTLQDFLMVADEYNMVDEYVEFFTSDADVIIARRRLQNRDQIAAERYQAVTGFIVGERHGLESLLPSGKAKYALVMSYGTVDYLLVNGQRLLTDFASRVPSA